MPRLPDTETDAQRMLSGGLFPGDFLSNGIRDLPEWASLDNAALDRFTAIAQERLTPFLTGGAFEEAETEQKLVFPLLEALGWGYLPQQKTGQRRESIPDALLFASPALVSAALRQKTLAPRSAAALVVEESKAWDVNLDRGERRTPASQALRYLREAE